LTAKVDAAYVRKQLADIVKDQDLSRYIQHSGAPVGEVSR
jgi:ATP-dependent protease HslVU (ClpYQ) ATPase subunit